MKGFAQCASADLWTSAIQHLTDGLLNPRVLAPSLNPFGCQFWTIEGGFGDPALYLETCIREATRLSGLKAILGGPCLSEHEIGRARNRQVMKWYISQATSDRA